MDELKTSALLTQLIEKAKKIGELKNPPFTAERFLVAIIDMLLTDPKASENEEMAVIRDMLQRKLGHLPSARKELLRYICDEDTVPFLDDLYMKKKLRQAFVFATESKMLELDSVTVVMLIFQDPSHAVKALMLLDGEAPENDAPEQTDAEIKTPEPDPQSISFEELLDAFLENEDKENETCTDLDIPDGPEIAKAEISALVNDVKRIRAELQNAIFGQDNAINVFTTGYFQANMRAMIEDSRKRPRATFLFAGPPGVGKTFLAEKAAQTLKLPFMRFDMSEYVDKEANVEFCGSDKVYRNGKAGNVTSFVAENPQCVLLFDEIEKAHISVIHLFLQMLDAGRLRDNYTDREVSFTDTIIILTTNAGKQLYEESENGDFSTVSRKVIVQALQKDVNPQTQVPYFPGAICSRFASGNVVMFNHIGAHDLRAIAKKEIERNAGNLEKETGIKIRVDERVYTALLFSEGSAADARTVKSRAETFFNNELYELLRLVGSRKTKAGIGSIETIKIGIDLSRADADIVKLFAPAEKTKVLVFARPETVALCQSKATACELIGVQTVEAAVDMVKNQELGFVLLDMRCGAPANAAESLNVEDVESPARDFFKFLREQGRGIPVYLLEERGTPYSDEERLSFTRQGVRGVLRVTKGKNGFATKLDAVAAGLYQQASMVKLAKENKLITFETAQAISKNGKNAEINLFDFDMSVAVDSEDAKNVLSAVSKPNVRFEDVIGADDAKQELTYFVEYLKDPKKYMGTGVKAPKGIILYGPPGTGKTMLAKAMASEADVTFIAAEGNQFLTKFVGEGSEKVHKLFKTARKYAPSILFIDEIDAIAKERRGGADSSVNSEATLTAFLTEMDGFVSDPSKPVFVLAATNFDVEPGRDKSLDPALMRRFDRRVYIDLPNKDDRIKFLKMKLAKNPALAISEEKLDNIALRATGMSLAELDSAVELALRSAIRGGSTTVTDAILEEAFEEFNGGEAKKWDASQLERIARHEAGHTVLCWLSGETPSYVTIVARGDHGGYMQHTEQEGKALYTKDELLARIRTALGGRAAEIAYYGSKDGVSTGAGGDLASATRLAQQLVCSYGMDEDFGLAVIDSTFAASDSVAAEVRSAVNRILKEQMAEAVRMVSENKDKIDALVEQLLSKNHMNQAEIEQTILRM